MYMEVTHLIERKQIKALKLQVQQKIEAIHTIKLHSSAKIKMNSANKLINTLFCT